MLVWKVKENNSLNSDQHLLDQIFESSKLPQVFKDLFVKRGLSHLEIKNLIQPQLLNLKDPFLMKDMDKAVHRLIQAFKLNQKICIYADFDLDGTSGLAILKNGLEMLGFQNISYYQPKRLTEGYGFHPHAVQELHALGIELIVTVDVGITSHEAFLKAQELGLDVILTDHHLPSELLPKAYCVVNPNQKECSSGLGYLCGAGVAFYLIRALKKAFYADPELPHHECDLKLLLDFFCIGTLTDMVPLVEDNRVLVKHGMIALEKTQRPGLRSLMEALGLSGRSLSSQDIAIKFAPKLNALSRMESDILPIHIYLETDLREAERKVYQVLDNNSTRQSLQSESNLHASEILKNWPYKDFVFVASPEFHRGIIGLIATKLSQDYNIPAFVGSKNSEGVVVGSCRLPSGQELSLVEALQHCSQELNRLGGHSAAAGFEYYEKNEEQLILKLNEFFETQKNTQEPKSLEYDTEIQIQTINDLFMSWYDHFGPYGVGFEIPLFRLNQVLLKRVMPLKGGHYKLQMSQEGLQIDGLLFSPSDRQKNSLVEGEYFDLLVEVQRNYFKNKSSIQLLVKDLKTRIL